eukprot:gene5906-15926_t
MNPADFPLDDFIPALKSLTAGLRTLSDDIHTAFFDQSMETPELRSALYLKIAMGFVERQVPEMAVTYLHLLS